VSECRPSKHKTLSSTPSTAKILKNRCVIFFIRAKFVYRWTVRKKYLFSHNGGYNMKYKFLFHVEELRHSSFPSCQPSTLSAGPRNESDDCGYRTRYTDQPIATPVIHFGCLPPWQRSRQPGTVPGLHHIRPPSYLVIRAHISRSLMRSSCLIPFTTSPHLLSSFQVIESQCCGNCIEKQTSHV
jgi:hypothetical protein